MAKFNLKKIRDAASRKKAEKSGSPKKEKKKGFISQMKEAARDKKGLQEYIFLLAAAAIDAGDEILDELDELGGDGKEFIFEVSADIVIVLDKTLDIIEWILSKTFILMFRKIHDARMKLQEYRKELMQMAMMALLSATLIIGLYSWVTDYEYAYNGRTLGIVRDQQDVLEILDLVSEELTQEYGSSITIDPENDITFNAVISYGKEIDDADTVLRRFTYMGDIQAEAYAIYADGELLSIVESEKIANEVLDKVLDNYLKDDDDVEYEYVGFAEDIEIVPYSTSLSRVTSKNSAYKKIKSGGQQEVTYTVKSGDTLSGICEKLDVSMKELKSMNPGLDENTTIHIGDKFVITEEVPLLTVETVEVSTYAQKIKYETEYVESASYYEGDEVVTRTGKNGKARITARLTRHNGKVVERDVLKKSVITEPVNEVIAKGTKKKPPTAGTGTFIRPVNVGVYSGYGWRWGRMHYGIDLSTSVGTPIYAADGGVVTMSGWNGAYGYCIKINHGNGYETLYAHNSANYVSVGEKVFQGQHIAAVGNTGR
ncbi:MAG: peptidoglycan DD-metalloendopeptidase family protein, partial [Firmicutes bacterium]|nr:peptidoglycan DD-metalloendopeptidase family protein [Bacillota bacterium]